MMELEENQKPMEGFVSNKFIKITIRGHSLSGFYVAINKEFDNYADAIKYLEEQGLENRDWQKYGEKL